MTADVPNNETRIRILDSAEELFATRGYTSVKLRDIAAAVGMRHASLYYYAPGGKEQLFIEVTERSVRRHHDGMQNAIEQAGDDIRAQVYAVTRWLVHQPPLDLPRMHQADFPAIDPKQAERLMQLAYNALRGPLSAALIQAKSNGQVDVPDPDMAAMALVSLAQGVHGIPVEMNSDDREQMGMELADMLLNGWLRR